MTYDPSSNATSSPGSASGLTPCDAPAGQTNDRSAPAPAPASRSAPRVRASASMTRATSGLIFTGSSETPASRASAGLTASLVSRLQQRVRGSILYDLTWKISATPSGRPIYRLRASAARTSASAFTGWPTPTTPSGGQTLPPGTSATGRKPDGSKAQVTLKDAAALAGWATPTASEKLRSEEFQRGRTLSAAEAFSEPPTGFSVGTTVGGQLRAGHSRWLMRIPPAWDDCGVTAMPSTRKRRPTS